MKSAHFVFWVLSLLLSCVLTSCQEPEVKVVVNQLKPEMLNGKTVGVEGMVITTAYWPGKFIEEPVLDKTGKVLQHRLKGTHVCLLNEHGSIQECLERARLESVVVGKGRDVAVAALAKHQAKDPDYIFRIMLRADSRDQTFVKQSLVGNGRLSTGRRAGWLGSNGSPMWPVNGAMREINKRTLKADYTLSDSRTHQLVWKAAAVASKTVDRYYPSMAALEAHAPLRPLLDSMNAAAVQAIKK